MQKYLKRNERIQGYIKEILDDCKKHKASEIVEYFDKRLRDNSECIFQVNTNELNHNHSNKLKY